MLCILVYNEHIKKESEMFNKELIQETLSQLNKLASVCDNAETLDGVGFSKSDLIGHYIVEMPEDHIDENWMVISLQIVIKYQNQLNIDPKQFKDALKAYNSDQLKEIKKHRKERVKKRIRTLEDGNFEIYFPTKQSMRKFPKDLVKTEEWISEIDIPHGYAFIVKKEAREFVLSMWNKLSDWYVPEDALKAIKEPLDDSCIDLSRVIEYQLYIKGKSLSEQLIIEFKYNSEILEKVKEFKSRSYNSNPPSWNIFITHPSDLDVLNALINDYDTHVSKEILNELKDAPRKKDELKKIIEKAEKLKKEKEHENRPIANVEFAKNKFKISFSKFSYDFVNWIKANLTQRKFQGGADSYWEIENNSANIISFSNLLSNDSWKFKKNARLKIEQDSKKAIEDARLNELKSNISLALSSSEKASSVFNPDLSLINGELLSFQMTVLEYATIHENIIIGDDMGLGKSLSALACAAMLGLHDSTVIACPAIARLTWRDEINKWLPNSTFYIAKKANSKKMAEKEKKDILEADFVIVSYNKIKFYEDVLRLKKAKLFIADESQYLKTKTSQRTKASQFVSESAGRVYLLSGTPLTNRPKELISQLNMIRVLDEHFGGEKAFLFKYCGADHNGFGWTFNGSDNLSELRQKLRETCMVRRKKDAVMKYLPKKRRIKIPVEISNRKEYVKSNENFTYAIVESLKIQAEKDAKRANIKKKDIDKFINKEIKIGLESAIRGKMFAHTNVLRNLIGKGLVESAVEWSKNFVETGKQLVIFAYHNDVQDEIYNELSKNSGLRIGKILSGYSDEYRKEQENLFQSGELDILVCSQMGANTNITLTASNTVLSIEYTYTPGNHIQAEDRCRRIGTSEDFDSIDCYYLHAVDTIDENFWNILSQKFTVIENTLDTDDAENFENIDGDIKEEIFNNVFSSLMESKHLKAYA